MSNGYKILKFKNCLQLAMEIFEISKSFPQEEKYALTDQIRRSSRSVCTTIAEGYRKRIYPKHFKSKITDSDGETSETQVLLDFARDCKYINKETHQRLSPEYEEVGKMLGSMINNPRKFLPNNMN